MKLHYKGKYDLNPDSLPAPQHQPGAVKFKEAENSKKLGIIANLLALFIAAVMLVFFVLRCGTTALIYLLPASVLSLLILFPHELLHAVCFKEDVYLYTNLRQGMLFVLGPETMSRARFVFMSLFPNLVFGFIPYTLAMIWPELAFLGALGAISAASGAGDYYNVFNALTQMPRGARTYLHKFNSYWYMP